MNWLLWALLSAVFAAATAVLAKLGVQAIDSNLATAIRTSVILLFTWGIALSTGSHAGLHQIGRRNWVFLVLSGLATGASWLCYFRALQLGPGFPRRTDRQSFLWCWSSWRPGYFWVKR